MRSLIEQIYREARRRGHLDPSLELESLRGSEGLATLFELVREMPYLRALDREPSTTIREWRGTCSGKHYLLKALYEELGYRTELLACTTWVRPELGALLPEGHESLMAEGPIPDLHNYLRLYIEGAGQLIDATAPLWWGEYGIPVNPEFVVGVDSVLLFDPLEEFEVPWTDGIEGAQRYKDQLLREHFSPAELERRTRFFGALAGFG